MKRIFCLLLLAIYKWRAWNRQKKNKIGTESGTRLTVYSRIILWVQPPVKVRPTFPFPHILLLISPPGMVSISLSFVHFPYNVMWMEAWREMKQSEQRKEKRPGVTIKIDQWPKCTGITRIWLWVRLPCVLFNYKWTQCREAKAWFICNKKTHGFLV